MLVSDPPIVFDMKRIGEKVQFNQFKYDSMDGFIKSNEECLIILPSVHKYNQGGGLGEVIIKANVLPLSYEFPWKIKDKSDFVLREANNVESSHKKY